MKMVLQTLMVLSLALSFAACSAQKTAPDGTQASEKSAQALTGDSPAASAIDAETGSVARAGGRTFRGDIGGRSIEMRLQRSGENLSGTYFYEGIGQNLTLKGRVDAKGKLSLEEFDASGKQTGKLNGTLTDESDQEPSATIEGQWSQPDGSHQVYFLLTEQHVEFTSGLRVVSKTIRERRLNISATYPQLAGSDEPSVKRFNEQAEALMTKAVKEFKENDPPPDRSSYSANYNIRLATDDLISVEISEDDDAGGAHPNSGFDTLNYDLRAGRELQLKELFKPGADYKKAIQQYALKDLNARAKKEEEESHTPPDQRNEQLFSPEELSEWSGWTMTRKGIFVYYDFPHVIAVFDREFIPYQVLKDQLDPQRAASIK